jgi:hypothetical protein
MHESGHPDHRRALQIMILLLATALLVHTPSNATGIPGPRAQSSLQAQEPATIHQPSERSVPSDLEVILKYQELVTKERESLEAQANRQFAAIEKLLDRASTIFGFLILAMIGVSAWFFGKTRRELQASIRDMLAQEARAIFDVDVRELRQVAAELKAEYNQLKQYQEKTITWVRPNGSPMNDIEVRGFGTIGISRIHAVEPAANADFALGTPALVILTFVGNDESRRVLRAVVAKLRASTPQIILIVYTYAPGGGQVRLDSEDQAVLAEYPWHLPVNYPVRLLAEVQTLLKRVPWGVVDAEH